MVLLFQFIFYFFIFIGCNKGSVSPTKRDVVSLSPNTTEIISRFFPKIRIIGRTVSCNYPDFIKNTRIACYTKPDIELLYHLKPKKIFLEKQLFQEREILELKKVAPLFIFCSKNLRSYVQSLKSIENEFGESIFLKKYIQKLEQGSSIKSSKKFIFLLDGGPKSNYYIAGKQSFLSDILKISGYECVGPNGYDFQSIDIEKLMSYSFDGIITGDSSYFIDKDPRLKGFKFFKIPDDLLCRAGARVDQLISMIKSKASSGP